jgi:hypothetical protein
MFSPTPRHHRTPALLLALACLVPACAAKQTTPPTDQPMCTTEAKMCPDGSGVGRTGPNCEFAPCPGAAAEPTEPPASPEAATPPAP